jgi:hypothetical protein
MILAHVEFLSNFNWSFVGKSSLHLLWPILYSEETLRVTIEVTINLLWPVLHREKALWDHSWSYYWRGKPPQWAQECQEGCNHGTFSSKIPKWRPTPHNPFRFAFQWLVKILLQNVRPLKFTWISISSMQTSMKCRFLKGSMYRAPFACIEKHRLIM